MGEAGAELAGLAGVDQAFQTGPCHSYAVTLRRQSGRPIATPMTFEMANLGEGKSIKCHEPQAVHSLGRWERDSSNGSLSKAFCRCSGADCFTGTSSAKNAGWEKSKSLPTGTRCQWRIPRSTRG
jgi:hypothetical protein